MTRETNETYIGDGVYASFDGFQIKLRTSRSPNDRDVDDEIYIGMSELSSLIEFINKSFGMKNTKLKWV